MIEQITFSELDDALLDIPPEVTVLLLGPAGIGKSAFIHSWARKQNTRFYYKNCAEMLDIGDLLGRNSVVDGVTVNNPPPWYSATEKTILCMDEINRCGQNSILRGCMGLVLTQSIADLKLPEGSRVICAANPEEGTYYDVIPFDLAQSNRFFVAELKCDTDYWLKNVAIPGKYNQAVIDFITKYPDYLHQLSNSSAVATATGAKYYRNVLSTPRSWEAYSKTLNNMERRLGDTVPERRSVEIRGAGYIGPVLAGSFASYYLDRRMAGFIKVPALLTGDGITQEDREKMLAEFARAIKEDPSRAIDIVTEIHSYLKMYSQQLFSKKKQISVIAENYYTLMSMCPQEYINMAYTNFISQLFDDPNNYFNQMYPAKPEIRNLFDSSTPANVKPGAHKTAQARADIEQMETDLARARQENQILRDALDRRQISNRNQTIVASNLQTLAVDDDIDISGLSVQSDGTLYGEASTAWSK
jgi:GTPase SAR1 family protein